MMNRSTATLSALLLGLFVAATALAQEAYDSDAVLAVSQAAIGESVGNYTLRDVDGQSFPLNSLRGKPLVVSLIYTSCHHVCPLITQNLAASVDIAQEALGADSFSVITVGFDWAIDTPDRMRLYAAERRIDVDGWHFLSGDANAITNLSEDLGFQFFPSAKGFDHLSQTTIVDSDGRIYTQVYGQDFAPPTLVEPLKTLVFDTPPDVGFVAHWVDTFKLFCTVYDPNSGRYKFDYSIFMTILVGVLCLGAIGLFILSEWRHAR